MFVIITNKSSSYYLAPEVYTDVTNLLDLPYDIPEDDEAFLKLATFYLEQIIKAVNSGRSIILIHGTPLALEMLRNLHDKPTTPNAAEWVMVSFFHEDEELINTVSDTPTDIRLDDKLEAILELIKFPFIKKINIPYCEELTFPYLTELVDTLSD
jgi:ABC-type uncharacterized transport system substrate-binding protein